MGIRESCPKNSKRRFLLFFMERDRDGDGGGDGGGWSVIWLPQDLSYFK